MARDEVGLHVEVDAAPLLHQMLVIAAPVVAGIVAHEIDASESTVMAVLADVVGPHKCVDDESLYWTMVSLIFSPSLPLCFEISMTG